MLIIRGATTISSDTKKEIQSAVSELLEDVFSSNSLKKEEVRGFVYSLTQDIHSYSPAKATRECGYDFAPLFCAVEPDIQGGLPLCIRLMLLVELKEERKIKHSYLKGATALRKDLTSVMNIALDGPAGSGKSTIAKVLANDYQILYLDTGAMYRACALVALRAGVDPKDAEGVFTLSDQFDEIRVEYQEGTQHTFIGDEDVSTAIRQNEVSMAASTISAHPFVRVKMVEMQRKIAGKMSCVLDGRDIGSTVLPNAQFKFFVTADSKVRAERRYKELIARGQTAELESIHEEIIRRDKQDSEREFSPLKQADDAIVVDTSFMDIEEVVKTIKGHIQSKI